MTGGTMEFLIVLAVLTAIVLFVSVPLRPDRAREDAVDLRGSDLPELEAARDAKYREIRDAELDHRTGKLSDADFHELDGALRAEAVEIMRAIDRGGATGGRLTDDRLPSRQS